MAARRSAGRTSTSGLLRSTWPSPVASGLAVLVLMTASCTTTGPEEQDPEPPPSSSTPAAEGTLLPEGTAEIEIDIGETVQVSLPDGSVGIGDHWGVLAVADPDVADADVAIGSAVFGAPPNRTDGGTEPVQQFAIEVTGTSAGETTVTVLYCTRTREVSEDCDQSQGTLEPPVDPVELIVSVR